MKFCTWMELNVVGGHKEEAYGGRIRVEWELELECREWGVQGFKVLVKDQVCEVQRLVEPEDGAAYFVDEKMEIKQESISIESVGISGLRIRDHFRPIEVIKHGEKISIEFL